MPVIPPLLDGALLAARDSLPLYAEIDAFAYSGQVMRFCDFAAMTWLVYDWFHTLENEVKLIWQSSNTPPKVLYLFSRYLGLAVVITAATGLLPFYCYSRLIFTSSTYHMLNYSVEISLMIRVYALWGQQRHVALILIFVFMMAEAGSFYILCQGMLVLKPLVVPAPSSWPVGGCITLSFPSLYRFCWVPYLIFETLMFILSCVRCLSYGMSSDTPIVAKVFRDSAIYYLCLLLFFLMYTIGLLTGNATSYLDAFTPAVLSFASSHLLLSIRAFVYKQKRAQNAVSAVCLGCGEAICGAGHDLSVGDDGLNRSAGTLMTTLFETTTTSGRRDEDDVVGGPSLLLSVGREEHQLPSCNIQTTSLPSPPSKEDDDATPGHTGHTPTSGSFRGFAEWIVAE